MFFIFLEFYSTSFLILIWLASYYNNLSNKRSHLELKLSDYLSLLFFTRFDLLSDFCSATLITIVGLSSSILLRGRPQGHFPTSIKKSNHSTPKLSSNFLIYLQCPFHFYTWKETLILLNHLFSGRPNDSLTPISCHNLFFSIPFVTAFFEGLVVHKLNQFIESDSEKVNLVMSFDISISIYS